MSNPFDDWINQSLDISKVGSDEVDPSAYYDMLGRTPAGYIAKSKASYMLKAIFAYTGEELDDNMNDYDVMLVRHIAAELEELLIAEDPKLLEMPGFDIMCTLLVARFWMFFQALFDVKDGSDDDGPNAPI